MTCSQLIDRAAILWHHEDYAHKENGTVNMEKTAIPDIRTLALIWIGFCAPTT